MPDDSPITEYIQAWRDGDPEALEALMSLVYTELQEMSRGALRGKAQVQTLNPTALVHEVYMRLAKLKKISWDNRKPFFSYASTLMRYVIVDYARRAAKARIQGGLVERIDLELQEIPDKKSSIVVLELEDVLSALEKQDPFLAKIIELRFFLGFNEQETAEALGTNRTHIQREWRIGKKLLEKLLRGEK